MQRTLLLLIFSAMAGIWGVAQQSGLPVIFLHRTLVTLKDVRPNTTIPARFTFSNIGDKPLVIEKVTTSCGCTSVTLSKETLNPKEEGWLDVAYRAEGRRTTASHKITMITNDPLKQEITLTLQVKVEPDIEWEPIFFELDWPPKADYTGEITFKASGNAISIKRVASEKDFLKARLAKQEGNTAVVQFTVPAGKDYVASNSIAVETDSKDYPVAHIMVYFKRPPEYLFEGDLVDFDVFEGTEPPVFRATLARKDGSKIRIESIEPSQKDFQVKILKNDAKTCEFEVTLAQGLRPGPCDGYLTIKTDQGDARLAVPCAIRKR